MTLYEKTIANGNFIAGIQSRIGWMERCQERDMSVEPVYVAVAEDEISFVWPMGFEHDHRKLDSLRSRLDAIRKIEENRPRVELPPIIPIYG